MKDKTIITWPKLSNDPRLERLARESRRFADLRCSLLQMNTDEKDQGQHQAIAEAAEFARRGEASAKAAFIKLAGVLAWNENQGSQAT